MTPILTIRLEKVHRKAKTRSEENGAKKMKDHSSKQQENPNEFIESEVTLDEDSPEKKGDTQEDFVAHPLIMSAANSFIISYAHNIWQLRNS